MHAYVQFITTPAPDTPGTALLLHFDDKRYIFGQIHEGLQRASLETGTKLLKVKDIFISGRTEWSNIGGLLGVILTLADSTKSANTARSLHAQQRAERRAQRGAEETENPEVLVDPTLRIHGGRNLTHALAAARGFIFRQGMPVQVQEFDTKTVLPNFEDNRIRLWALPILPSNPRSPRKRTLDEFVHDDSHSTRQNVLREMFKSDWRYDALVETNLHAVQSPAQVFVRDPVTKLLSKYTGPVPNTDGPDMPVLVRQAWPGALVGNLPATSPSPVAISYIIKAHKQRGKFRTDLAKGFGLKPGKMFSRLVEGHSVEAPDGRLISRDMVLDEGREGGGTAILDLPTAEYIPDLLERPEFADEELMRRVETFIWLLGPGVKGNPSLQGFMENHPAVRHVISSPDVCEDNFPMAAAAKAHVHHHMIDPERYRVFEKSTIESTNNYKYIAARSGMQIILNPTFSFSHVQNPHCFDLEAAKNSVSTEVLAAAAKAREQPFNSHEASRTGNTTITCLGTGSSAPSPCRNVSSTLVRVPGCGSYLLDCGEGTLGQIRRLFPQDEADQILQDLKMIWISHLHADHHLGTASIIRAWQVLQSDQKLFVVGPEHMSRFLQEYGPVEDLGKGHVVPLSVRPDGMIFRDVAVEHD